MHIYIGKDIFEIKIGNYFFPCQARVCAAMVMKSRSLFTCVCVGCSDISPGPIVGDDSCPGAVCLGQLLSGKTFVRDILSG